MYFNDFLFFFKIKTQLLLNTINVIQCLIFQLSGIYFKVSGKLFFNLRRKNIMEVLNLILKLLSF